MSELLPQLIQQLFNGLSLGAIYALIAIGYTMVYGIIGMINFAHGEIYMIGAYVGLVTLTAIGTGSGLPVPFIIAAMLLVAIVVTGIYGFSVERVAYRPVRGSPRLVALISAIGMSIFLQNWVALGQGARDMAVPSLVSGAVQFHMGSDFDVTVPYSRIMIIVVTVVLMIGLTLFIKYSRMGRAWLAIKEDPLAAASCGINLMSYKSVAFAFSAGVGALAGCFLAQWSMFLAPDVFKFWESFLVLCMIVLGGLGNINGAIVGAVVLVALGEILRVVLPKFGLPAETRFLVYGLIMILIMRFKPGGFFPAIAATSKKSRLILDLKARLQAERAG